MIDPDRFLDETLTAISNYHVAAHAWVIEPDAPDLRMRRASAARRELCRRNPLAFALIYLRKHLVNSDNRVTLGDLHVAVTRHCSRWADEGLPAEPMADRTAWVSPRESGKSTWVLLAMTLWAAAYGYTRFTMAFSDSATQSEQHLETLRRECESNELLRRDFPELCTPRRRPSGSTNADNRSQYTARNGFTYRARGADSSSLGAKVGESRPDLILLDDVEGGASNYSEYQARQRLSTILNDVLPMNLAARVVYTGTTTINGGITHQLVLTSQGSESPSWVDEANFKVNWIPALYQDEAGVDRSCWPAKWPVAQLLAWRGQRWFALNMQNKPVPEDSAYWTQEDFTRGRVEAATRVLLSIDPAVTTKKQSDQTALAVIAWSPSEGRCEVREAVAVRLRGAELRTRVLGILQRHTDIRRVIVESNQGGDLWTEVLHDLPVKVESFTVSEKKEVRAARLLHEYQQGRVLHGPDANLTQLEEQMQAFPSGLHDDLVDAVGNGVLRLLYPPKRPTAARAAVRSYV